MQTYAEAEKEIAMGGIFGAASQESCVFDLFFGIDYHSHLGSFAITTAGKINNEAELCTYCWSGKE